MNYIIFSYLYFFIYLKNMYCLYYNNNNNTISEPIVIFEVDILSKGPLCSLSCKCRFDTYHKIQILYVN